MADVQNREEWQEEYGHYQYNNKALLAAYPFTAQRGLQFPVDQRAGNESEIRMFQEGMHFTHEQALDSYREGTVEALPTYKKS